MRRPECNKFCSLEDTRTFYGVELEVVVKCSCGELEETVTLADDIQASAMDELA